MKQIKIVLLMVILTGLCSCRKNLLTVQPTNLLTADQIVSNDASITAYFASLYRDLPMEDFNFVKGVFYTFPDGGGRYLANYDDEAISRYDFESTGSPTPSLIGNLSGANATIYDEIYKAIRNVNTFIQLVSATNNFIPAQQAQYIAEAKFIRAYYYYGLVKYYGGVPIVLNIPATPTPLPRNKEFEVYDQIKKDLDDAAAGLPALSAGYLSGNPAVNGVTYGYGRANKWVALALESRVMLHAASIGYFATADPSYVSFVAPYNGICGIDMTHAQVYMQAAYDAAKAVMASNVFTLYQKYATPGVATLANSADYAKNFQYLFYDTKQGDSNSEAIFNRGVDIATATNTHSQDLTVLPHDISSPVAQGYGNSERPTLDLMEKFEMIDGSSPILGSGAVGAFNHYPAMTTPFLMKDPRYHGTIISNGTFFKTEIITAQKGVILNNATINGNNYKQFFDTNPASSTYKQFNTDPSKFNNNKATTYVVGTGNSAFDDNGSCWLKKWTDPVLDVNLIKDYSSRTSWMDLRYGEVLLDFAEASFELNQPAAEQLAAINLLRARAGIPALTTISRAAIRHERLVELAYENKSWWDYSRWRAFATDFTSRQEYTLQCYWDLDTNDYVYIKQTSNGPRNINAKWYYADIPGTDASQNPLLLPSHNPGY